MYNGINYEYLLFYSFILLKTYEKSPITPIEMFLPLVAYSPRAILNRGSVIKPFTPDTVFLKLNQFVPEVFKFSGD